MQIAKILVVYDPTTDLQPALARAALIAGRDKVTVHLFSCIYTDLGKSGDVADQRKLLLSAQQEIVAGAASSLIEKGIEVTTEVEWDEDWYQAVIRASKSNHADVVLKASHKHSATQRLLKPTSDRTLIRQCDCPVLLVKGEVNSDARKVLAAIDTRGQKDSYKQLNENILNFCQRFMQMEDAELHFVNAHEGLSDRPDKGSLVRACGVAADNVHVRMGDPDKVIVEVAKSLDVNLVVIGNSARSGLSALINTNTAEKILDELDCDLLALP
jgi:universal stress protein E